jgi:hypothetical protein
MIFIFCSLECLQFSQFVTVQVNFIFISYCTLQFTLGIHMLLVSLANSVAVQQSPSLKYLVALRIHRVKGLNSLIDSDITRTTDDHIRWLLQRSR